MSSWQPARASMRAWWECNSPGVVLVQPRWPSWAKKAPAPEMPEEIGRGIRFGKWERDRPYRERRAVRDCLAAMARADAGSFGDLPLKEAQKRACRLIEKRT